MTAALALCVAGVGFADSITIDGVAYEDVYVRESASSYYVQIPSDGRAITVAKDKVDPEDVSISGDAEHRKALLNEWKGNNAEHQEERTEEQRTQAREAAAKERAAALELLDKYAATQDRLQRAIVKSKTLISTHMQLSEANPPYDSRYKGKYEEHFVTEHRYDGHRFYHSGWHWGDVLLFNTTSRERKGLRSYLWDGKATYQFSSSELHGDVSDGVLGLRENVKKPPFAFNRFLSNEPDGYMLGCFQGHRERIDVTLRECPNTRVRDEMESVSGVDCHVIEGDTRYGKYTLWLDPEHGYNMAKARIERKPGDVHYTSNDKYGDTFLPAGREVTITVDNVRFEKIDDTWAPMEGDEVDHKTFPHGEFSTIRSHTQLTDIILDPDHEALGSFVPDYIPDDAIVCIPGRSYGPAGGPDGPPTWREWRKRQAGGGE